ncbi:MAG TPA: hypothetical protein VFW25_06475 [Silvibacterium sp.]|nr:hypothetical protein [Silvibacterium sp.]
MRRLLAISLLMLFASPFALPLFATSSSNQNAAACCRRNGRHHCAATRAGNASDRVVGEKCRYCSGSPAMLVLPSFTASDSASIFAGILRHPSVLPQTEAQGRVSFDRSRQKRGPPQVG